MYKIWKKKSQEEIKTRVFEALNSNINYSEQSVLGIPASYLDNRVFSAEESFLKDAPFISTLIKNPNHIGCHTIGESESYFKGTQEIEKELIEICSVDILKGKPQSYDGYIASGGTEANLQAIWIYRNYFIQKLGAKREEITIICSEDSHYSMDKAANVFVLDIEKAKVERDTRKLTKESINHTVKNAKENGKKYFIVISNMMTTMFGSVDNVDFYSETLEELGCEYKIHIDAAFGGFYYPFTKGETSLSFANPKISSFTLDAHKMAQAPYGTGIFLIEKGMIHYANTEQASYVAGEDCTLIGSRSGANAISVWMILVKNGPFGWQEKIFILQHRTEWLCKQLKELSIQFCRFPKSNIVTIKSEFVSEEIAKEFGLVPDNHKNPSWYKIVVMDHVTIDKLILLLEKLGYKH